MKKILMISYDWPPQGSVGMIRAVRFAKYLKRLGHEVSVVTRQARPGGTITWDIDDPEIKAVGVRRAAMPKMSGIGDYFTDRLNPQFESSFYRAAMADIDNICTADFDVVISSSPPESAHAIAAGIKGRKKAIWMADLRDLWSDDHYRGFDTFRRALIRHQELGILERADIITTVSDAWGALIRKRYGDRIKVIPNGYDKDYFDRIGPSVEDKLTISYLGKLNGRHQDVTKFLVALKNLVQKGSVLREKLKVDFYVTGYGKPDIASMAREYGLAGMVEEHGPIPFGRALGIMKNSSLLLLAGWAGLSASGWRPQKLYEYLGSGTPMLLVNGRENMELKSFIRSAGNCRIADKASDIEMHLKHYYDAFSAGEAIKDAYNPKIVAEYEASSIVKRLSGLIEGIGIG